MSQKFGLFCHGTSTVASVVTNWIEDRRLFMTLSNYLSLQCGTMGVMQRVARVHLRQSRLVRVYVSRDVMCDVIVLEP